MNITKYQLEAILEGLQDAVKVTKLATDEPDQGYPYAYGYLQACVTSTIASLKMMTQQ